jgi:lysophospholipase L1-like esterase
MVAALAGLVLLTGWGDGGKRNARRLDDGDDAEPEKRRYVVAAMGDSLTDPKSHGGKYLAYLRKRCPKSRFDSYGKGGNMVNQMRRRFARDILGIPKKKDDPPKPKYTHVIVLGGINDICSDESANRTNNKIMSDLRRMYHMAQAHDIEVIALTLPPWAGFEKYYNERRGRSTHLINRWIRRQVKHDDVDSVLDIFPMLSCGEPDYLCEDYGWPDKVHWNKKGHEVVGKALLAHDFSDCE